MILKDTITKLLLKMEPFMTKKGNDITIRREVIDPLTERSTGLFDSESGGVDRDRDRDRYRGNDDDRPVIRLF